LEREDKFEEFVEGHMSKGVSHCEHLDFYTKYQLHVSYRTWIDIDWKLNKRILNFCTISSHKGDELGKTVEKCLIEWEIENVFTITVDNANSNDKML